MGAEPYQTPVPEPIATTMPANMAAALRKLDDTASKQITPNGMKTNARTVNMASVPQHMAGTRSDHTVLYSVQRSLVSTLMHQTG